MPMEIDRKELKRRARESMSLANPSFWTVTLVYILMTTGVSALADFAPGMLAAFLSIALTLYSWVVGFSYRLWALWTARRLEPGLGSLMDGFSVAGRVIMLELSIIVRIFGWCLLLILPITFAYAGALVFTVNPFAIMTVYVIMLLTVALLVNVITLRYALSYYVLADYPDLGPGIALAHSVRLVKGWVWELVKLHLSFAGWYVLTFALSVIGMVVGDLITGGVVLSGVMSAAPEFGAGLSAMVTSPLPVLLGNLLALPATLYFTPYLEVTLAEFYNARINLGDNMADPMGGMKVPPIL